MTKKRTIAGFDQVANDSNINSKNNNNNNSKKAINDLLGNKKTKAQTHTFRGYYLENDVADTIEKLGEGETKGFKSELVNEILKKYFKNEGIM